MLQRYFNEIFRLFFPERCAACGKARPEGSGPVCPQCRWEMPVTQYAYRHDNPVYRSFDDLLPVVEASAFMFYNKGSQFQHLIHGFKYEGQWKTCRFMGTLLGETLHESGLYAGIDLIVPIPLHIRRRFKRGYNQTEYLAEAIGKVIGKPVVTDAVKRKVHNPPQAVSKNRTERLKNAAGIFEIRKPELLHGKHLLLIDDVLTTGATMVSFGNEILSKCPSAKISVATLAVATNESPGIAGSD